MSSRFCPNVPDSSDGYSLLGAPGIRGETAAVSETREALRQERGEGRESPVERVRKGPRSGSKGMLAGGISETSKPAVRMQPGC